MVAGGSHRLLVMHSILKLRCERSMHSQVGCACTLTHSKRIQSRLNSLSNMAQLPPRRADASSDQWEPKGPSTATSMKNHQSQVATQAVAPAGTLSHVHVEGLYGFASNFLRSYTRAQEQQTSTCPNAKAIQWNNHESPYHYDKNIQ